MLAAVVGSAVALRALALPRLRKLS